MKTTSRNQRSLSDETSKAAAEFVRFGQQSSSPARAAITRDPFNGNLRVSYEFAPHEAQILETLSMVSGVSLDWFVADALSWTRGYLRDLTQPSSGMLKDLVDVAHGGHCPIPVSRRKAAVEFISEVKSKAGNGLVL